ncbi:uncharacterized protein An07g05890 [Aspergillus niger]|uniref:Contig An07c0160, genomic contig n=2 Tax=Aspergillus niger TaxID=5061 RepID=E2PSQ2_ASPNC|nr:uncharacterized protein An07g05890 [Aspergillus niger]CAK48959.1 unnamed protein product [Aspergillus niger]
MRTTSGHNHTRPAYEPVEVYRALKGPFLASDWMVIPSVSVWPSSITGDDHLPPLVCHCSRGKPAAKESEPAEWSIPEEAPNERLSGRLILIKPAEAEENAEKLHDFAGLTWLEVAGLWTPDKAQPGPQCAQCWQLVGTQWIPSDVRAPLKYGLVARPPQTSKSLQE